jgi:hypothetical protein
MPKADEPVVRGARRSGSSGSSPCSARTFCSGMMSTSAECQTSTPAGSAAGARAVVESAPPPSPSRPAAASAASSVHSRMPKYTVAPFSLQRSSRVSAMRWPAGNSLRSAGSNAARTGLVPASPRQAMTRAMTPRTACRYGPAARQVVCILAPDETRVLCRVGLERADHAGARIVYAHAVARAVLRIDDHRQQRCRHPASATRRHCRNSRVDAGGQLADDDVDTLALALATRRWTAHGDEPAVTADVETGDIVDHRVSPDRRSTMPIFDGIGWLAFCSRSRSCGGTPTVGEPATVRRERGVAF